MRIFLFLVCLVGSDMVLAHSDADTAPTDAGKAAIATDDQVSSLKGESIKIPVLENDQLADFTVGDVTVKITMLPKEGVLSVDPEDNTVKYRHGGASDANDQFTYVIEHQNTVVSNAGTVTISFRPIQAVITITSPANNAVIAGDTIVVEYAIDGSDFDHVHVNLDDQHNTVDNPSGSYTFRDVSPGPHKISVNLSNDRHQVVRMEGAEDSVKVQVVAK